MKKISELTEAQKAQMDSWADKWIDIGLRTGAADRERFEAAMRECYRFAGLDAPKRVVWVPSPLVGALAAPIAGWLLSSDVVRGAVDGAVGDVVGGVVHGAVGGVVGGVVHDAVDGVVRGAVDDVVRGVVGGAVHDAVDDVVRGVVLPVHDAVHDAVRGAVHGAVGGVVGGVVHGAVGGVVGGVVHDAVDGVVRGAVHGAVGGVVRRDWSRYLGGQFWAAGWYWGGAYVSFFRECAGLELPGDLWDRARAYEATIESACWWWPYKDFVMVCERPREIHRELTDPSRERGWGSHRLHCETGPAVAWEGWGVYAWHGVVVPAQVIEAPETLTVEQISAEDNAEVRRIMIERFGPSRYMTESGCEIVDVDTLALDGSAPRALLRDKHGDNWFVGTDGSTARCYHLPAPRGAVTVREAHEVMCGFDETRLVAES